jgi:hypothetical protein
VPETSVNEYRYPCGSERNIWSARKPWVIDSESETTVMQLSAYISISGPEEERGIRCI